MAHPDSPRVVQEWAPGFAALATNHILDSGEDGLALTIQSLRDFGFATLGAGVDADEITRPACWDTPEGRLAIVNWVFPETHPDWQQSPGPNCWPGLEEAERLIHDLRQTSDWVMVVAHWSDEHFSFPRPEERALARELERMGVDVILGHHPHVVRGMETIGSCPVYYSLGNFYFSDIPNQNGGWKVKQAPRNREGLGVIIQFKKGQPPSCEALSFWKAKGRVILDRKGRAINRMTQASQPLNQLQTDNYAQWYTVQRDRFAGWEYRLNFRLWQLSGGELMQSAWKQMNALLRNRKGR